MASARTWRPVETRLLAEWLATRHADKRVLQHVRLGGIPAALVVPGLPEAEARMAGVWRRWVDALVVEPGRLLVVEASVVAQPGNVSQLELYLSLIPHTPELAEFRGLELLGVLVHAVDDPAVRRLARDRRFLVEVFRPAWVDGYLDTLFPRKRVATLSAVEGD